MWEQFKDWKVWMGAVLTGIFFYVMMWSFTIGCVLIGNGPEICGL